jgi:hypothetical protein
MKIRNILVAIALSFCASNAAVAATVDFGNETTGGGLNTSGILLLTAPQDGTFFTSANNSAGAGFINGFLANGLKVIFTYHLAPNTPNFVISVGGSAVANSITNPSVLAGGVLATANVVPLIGTASISNFSGITQSFSTSFAGFLKQITTTGTTGRITYVVSAVPIPTSVLMFGAAIIGMFAFARKQRNDALLA